MTIDGDVLHKWTRCLGTAASWYPASLRIREIKVAQFVCVTEGANTSLPCVGSGSFSGVSQWELPRRLGYQSDGTDIISGPLAKRTTVCYRGEASHPRPVRIMDLTAVDLTSVSAHCTFCYDLATVTLR